MFHHLWWIFLTTFFTTPRRAPFKAPLKKGALAWPALHLRRDHVAWFQPWYPKWFIQWPFQEPKLEVRTIYKAYFFFGYVRGYTPKIWPENGTFTYLHIKGSWRSPIDLFHGKSQSKMDDDWGSPISGNHQISSMIINATSHIYIERSSIVQMFNLKWWPHH